MSASLSCRATCALIACAMLACGCSASSGGPQPTPFGTESDTAPPSRAVLEALLNAELTRLDVDPYHTPSAAPSGEENSVVSLYTYVDDPDGMGGSDPTAVVLRWTEQCVGDYNQDGLTGINDLTPLGQHYQEDVDYVIPGVRPAGNPWDDGGAGIGNPPLPGSGAENWRAARVDGNRDGLITINDITPIAQHWQQRLDGYRVYCLRPGDTQFDWIPNADNPALPYTVPRGAAFPPGSTTPDPHRPVNYEFFDGPLVVTQGVFEYYVAPYDAANDLEGQASLIVPADLGNGGGGSLPPVAMLTSDTEFGEVQLTVNYDAAPSWDPDGEVVRYEWDMDGDPSAWEYDSTPATTLQMLYNTAGTKDQWVRFTDNDGLSATTHIKVSVAQPGGNYSPVAQLRSEPPSGSLPLQVTWDAGESFDHDGTITKYEWDMDGNTTTWEYDSGPASSYQMTYNTAGEHIQWVRVTDNDGATDTAMGEVFVEGPAGNQPPTADIVPSATEGDAPFLISFDASGSVDPDGNIQQYEWDFNSDASIDATTAVPTAQYTYNDPGEYTPSVIVTDDLGASDMAYANVTIHGWVITTVDAGPNAGLYCSAALVDGVPGIAYNWDNWPTNGELRYTLAQNVEGTLWPSSPVVVDNGGGTNYVGGWCSLAMVSGYPAIGYFDGGMIHLKYIRANDQFGASWPATPVVVDNSGSAGQHISLAVIDGRPAMSYFVLGSASLAYVRAADAAGNTWNTRVNVNASPGVAAYTSLLEFQGTSTFPLIAHVDTSSQQVLFERANDAAGSPPWQPTEALCPAGECTLDASMALVNGLPAVVYYGISTGIPGMFYRRVQDSATWVWAPTQRLLTGGDNGVGADLGVVNGNPAVAYRFLGLDSKHDLMYMTATDADGISWGTPEYVDTQDDVGYYASLVDINGHPGIAYQDYTNGQLKFAYRY